MSRTVDWLYILSPPVAAREEVETSDEELGRLVSEALDASKQDVRHPSVPELERVSNPLLEVAGVADSRTFERDARTVEVHREDGVLTITPMRNVGRDGFVELTELEQRYEGEASELGAAELGAAVRRALAEAL